jgi:vanillate O-demethylase ferredoxin subunit
MALHEAPPLTLVVTRRETLCDDIVAFELRLPDGAELPAFEAGAHIDLHLPAADDAPGAIPRRRSYSLCNPPGERGRYLIAVQREATGRGGSAWLHAHLQAGDRIGVSAPRNLFALRPAPRHLLLAGGIGLTPLLAMAEVLWAAGQHFELHICVRSAQRLPFARRLLEAPWSGCVQVHADDADPALDLAALLAQQGADTLAYCCGPAGFMAAVQRAADDAGWPAERVVVEHFAAPPPPAAAAVEPGHFELDWAPTGQRLSVGPADSVARVLLAAGIELPISCEQGICGQCCLQVVAGEADHRDLVYGTHEHDVERRFTPCCSRAHSPRLSLAPLGWAAPGWTAPG